MISAKDLTDEQISEIREWAEAGAQLGEIQKRVVAQFGLNATYMDTRFLILDLGVELQSEEEEPAEEESAVEPAPPAEIAPEDAGEVAGTVNLTTDEVLRPGAMVSGSVTFSDGEKGKWWIDQRGPGLDLDNPAYQPSEADLMEFEQQLRKLLGT